jgi:CO dehydrogenase maturation factor
MKVAIAGKGGAGKTTLAAALARRQAVLGRPVVAVDADPDGNLAAALGVPPARAPTAIAQLGELIRQRTGASEDGSGLLVKLNPDVDDLPERYSVDAGGVRLLVLGTVEAGGRGCLCPESAVLKALLQHLLLRIPDDVILDMEAGLEHLGRASARGVDAMITVVEPGMRSVQTAQRVRRLAEQIEIRRTFVVLNRIDQPRQEDILVRALEGQTILGVIPYCPELARADLEGCAVDLGGGALAAAIGCIGEALDGQLACQARGNGL